MQIIDRRLAGKNKSIGNRERFIERYKNQIRGAVDKAVNARGIKDVGQETEVSIPRRDIGEPVFRQGRGGDRDTIHPGNTEFVKGDTIDRPKGGGAGGRGSQASDSGEGEDDFTFTLSKDEFMQVFFDGLALPNLQRTAIAEIPDTRSARAGFVSSGSPSNLSVIRSMRGALGRRIALGAGMRAQVQHKQRMLDGGALALADLTDAALEAAPATEGSDAQDSEQLRLEIAGLRARLSRIPFLDPIDLRFRNRIQVPKPSSKAVMFCVMDVSGSMSEERKALAKRFFILLHLFLTGHYEKIDVVFIRHHTQAEEVDEEHFFNARETGGTVVSSALRLMLEIMQARYAGGEWNIYGAQASDGDNYDSDNPVCIAALQKILPLTRYFAYLQVAAEEQSLWSSYKALCAEQPGMAMQKVAQQSEIYPVFRRLFERKTEQSGLAA